MTGPLNSEPFRRLLRWYPADWRRRNEEAVVGVLIDEALAAGRSQPSPSDRRSLFFGGIRERFLAEESPSRVTLAAFAAALGFSALYVMLVSWSPGVSFAGKVGPFSNGTVIAVLLLVAAFVSAVSKRAGASRAFAYLAALTEVGVWIVGSAIHGLGPSLSTALLFAGLAIMAGVRPTSILQLAKLVGAILLALVPSVVVPIVVTDIATLADPISRTEPSGLVIRYFVLPMIGWSATTLVAVAGALLLSRSAFRTRAAAAANQEPTG